MGDIVGTRAPDGVPRPTILVGHGRGRRRARPGAGASSHDPRGKPEDDGGANAFAANILPIAVSLRASGVRHLRGLEKTAEPRSVMKASVAP